MTLRDIVNTHIQLGRKPQAIYVPRKLENLVEPLLGIEVTVLDSLRVIEVFGYYKATDGEYEYGKL